MLKYLINTEQYGVMSNKTNIEPGSFRNNQTGLVSIVVTMVMMIVISLIVLSFASLSRREQRQSLDRQLATQALYAAESGINDTFKAITSPNATVQAGLAAGAYASNCQSFVNDAGLNQTLDTSTNTSYSCVQVNINPGDLQYKDVDTNSRVVSLQLTSGTIPELTIYWDGSNGQEDCTRAVGAVNTFPVSASWGCDMGLLRLDIIAVNADGSLPNADGRTYLTDNTATFFLSPVSGGTNTTAYPNSVGFLKQGTIVPGNCSPNNSPRACSVKITGMNGSRYYVRLKSLYRNSDVTISPTGGASGTTLQFANAQAVIDVTGKAQDVLKRLQVRVPLQPTIGSVPEFGVQSATTLCKKLEFTASTPSITDTDPACQ